MLRIEPGCSPGRPAPKRPEKPAVIRLVDALRRHNGRVIDGALLGPSLAEFWMEAGTIATELHEATDDDWMAAVDGLMTLVVSESVCASE